MTQEEHDAIVAKLEGHYENRLSAFVADKKQATADRFAHDAEWLEEQKAAAVAEAMARKPGWKSTEFWLALIPTVSGLLMSIAGAFGANPEHLQVAQQVVGTVTEAATGFASGRDPTEVITGAAMGTLPALAYILKRTAPKR